MAAGMPPTPPTAEPGRETLGSPHATTARKMAVSKIFIDRSATLTEGAAPQRSCYSPRQARRRFVEAGPGYIISSGRGEGVMPRC